MQRTPDSRVVICLRIVLWRAVDLILVFLLLRSCVRPIVIQNFALYLLFQFAYMKHQVCVCTSLPGVRISFGFQTCRTWIDLT
jgi:hypothetical protein